MPKPTRAALSLSDTVDLIDVELRGINAQLDALLADLRREAQEERKEDDDGPAHRPTN